MKINDLAHIKQTSSIKKRGNTNAAGSDDFLQLLSGAGEESVGETQSSAPVAATSLDSLLALQEISDDDLTRKKAFQSGKQTLDALEQLRHALLMGNVPLHVLKNLSRAVEAQSMKVMDPKLSALMDDIKLRAAVEIAKLEMAAEQAAS